MSVGIELGSVGTAIGSVASGIGKAGASLDGMFGPKMGPVGLPVNEGPAGFGGLIETMPLQIGQINPIEKISFNAPARIATQSVAGGPGEVETIASVENFLAQVRMPQVGPMIMPEIAPMEAPLVVPKTPPLEFAMPPMEAPVARTVVEEAEEIAQQAWDNHVLTQTEQLVNSLDEESPARIATPAGMPSAKPMAAWQSVAGGPVVLPQPLPQEQEVEEAVEEKVEKKEPEERQEEEETVERQMYLEDENASAQRRVEIREAVVKARGEADRLSLKKLTGWLVAKFLPGEHQGNRSQVVKKTGPDGSYQETIEAISGAGELESEEQAVKRFNMVVAEKKPVKFGKNGTPVEGKDVIRVFKYMLFKPAKPVEEIKKRVVKKKVVPSPQPVMVKPELSIKDFPTLAGVFPKAA